MAYAPTSTVKLNGAAYFSGLTRSVHLANMKAQFFTKGKFERQYRLLIHSHHHPSHPITDCQPSPIPASKFPSHPFLFALAIVLHESILTPQFLKLLLSICFSGIADVRVGDGSLR